MKGEDKRGQGWGWLESWVKSKATPPRFFDDSIPEYLV